MSSIIKGNRIRVQSIIDFSSRQLEKSTQEEYIKETRESGSLEEEKQIIDLREEQLRNIQNMMTAKLEKAEQQANQILLEAIQKSKTLEEEALQLKNQMLFEVEAHKANLLEEAHKEAQLIIAKAQEEKAELIMSSEGEMVETLVQLLNHIISEEMKYDNQWLRCLVRKMISKEDISGSIKVVVSPILYEKLSEQELKDIEAISKDLIVETRDQINETTCMIEFNQGSIVYDITQGLDRVIKDIRILMNAK